MHPSAVLLATPNPDNLPNESRPYAVGVDNPEGCLNSLFAGAIICDAKLCTLATVGGLRFFPTRDAFVAAVKTHPLPAHMRNDPGAIAAAWEETREFIVGTLTNAPDDFFHSPFADSLPN